MRYSFAMNKNFIQEKTALLNSIPACTGDMARLGYALSEALNRLQAITEQANAQFKAGDSHATFRKDLIEKIESNEYFG